MKGITFTSDEISPLKPIGAGDIEIPGIGALVHGGFGNPAFDEYFREALNIGQIIIKNPRTTYYGYAWSDSTEPLISEGTMVIIDKTYELINGKYYVFRIDGELCMKRYWKDADGTVTLHSENPAYKPLVADGTCQIREVGRIISFIGSL